MGRTYKTGRKEEDGDGDGDEKEEVEGLLLNLQTFGGGLTENKNKLSVKSTYGTKKHDA